MRHLTRWASIMRNTLPKDGTDRVTLEQFKAMAGMMEEPAGEEVS